MTKTIKTKLNLSHSQVHLLKSLMKNYVETINFTVERLIKANGKVKLSSANVLANLPSALKNQTIRDAKSLYAKYKKTGKKSIARRPVAIWNNQNYSIDGDLISFPVWIDGKVKRLSVKIVLSEYQKKLLQYKLGTLRITDKSGKLFAQISVEKRISRSDSAEMC